jgi:hypothetical protein
LQKIKEILGPDFEDKAHLKEAFTQGKNRKLAQLVDNLLGLYIREREYLRQDSTPRDLENAKQRLTSKDKMRKVVNSDGVH